MSLALVHAQVVPCIISIKTITEEYWLCTLLYRCLESNNPRLIKSGSKTN